MEWPFLSGEAGGRSDRYGDGIGIQMCIRDRFNGQNKTVSITATRYTGTDHQYKTVTYNPTHSGGKGGSI